MRGRWRRFEYALYGSTDDLEDHAGGVAALVSPPVVKALLDHAEEADALIRGLAIGVEKARASACRCGDRGRGADLHALLMTVPEELRP